MKPPLLFGQASIRPHVPVNANKFSPAPLAISTNALGVPGDLPRPSPEKNYFDSPQEYDEIQESP